MKLTLPESIIPIGADRGRLCSVYARGLAAASVLGAAIFLIRYFSMRAELYYLTPAGERLLRDGFTMAPFAAVLRFSFIGFALLAIALALFAASCYRKYYIGGSRSIYLMRRLPDPWERHRRCLALPALGLLAAAAAAAVLLLIYYLIYVTVTPKSCLDPGQASGIWRALCLK